MISLGYKVRVFRNDRVLETIQPRCFIIEVRPLGQLNKGGNGPTPIVGQKGTLVPPRAYEEIDKDIFILHIFSKSLSI